MVRPLVWIGAHAPGALTLPPANPTPSHLYAPRGVYLDDRTLIVADSGNHRVLIWHSVPDRDGQPADVVLGQPDFYSEGPQAAGRGPRYGMYLPTGVIVIEGRLYVANSWNHRILVWDRIPETSSVPPDNVIGQADLDECEPNRGGNVTGRGFYWPYGIGWVAGRFYVADTGNRRVLGWNGIPEDRQPPDLVLGQNDEYSHAENRGEAPSACSFRWPHAIAGDTTTLYVADAGNHRVLGWTPIPARDTPACLALGQRDFQSAWEMPHTPPGPSALRFPYAVVCESGRLIIADTANNRVLVWHTLPREGAFLPADAVIGQPDFAGNGENRWQAVERDTLCWPYGISCCNNRLAIADSGNNRVIIWDISV
ncbi:MAG: NHL repeat-containing protein [Roseiflexaceae bacterium]|nr:NHL repeat-containing protein [Roseiflexaceae bacterium]